jgi:hypothetical protein
MFTFWLLTSSPWVVWMPDSIEGSDREGPGMRQEKQDFGDAKSDDNFLLEISGGFQIPSNPLRTHYSILQVSFAPSAATLLTDMFAPLSLEEIVKSLGKVSNNRKFEVTGTFSRPFEYDSPSIVATRQ